MNGASSQWQSAETPFTMSVAAACATGTCSQPAAVKTPRPHLASCFLLRRSGTEAAKTPAQKRPVTIPAVEPKGTRVVGVSCHVDDMCVSSVSMQGPEAAISRDERVAPEVT